MLAKTLDLFIGNTDEKVTTDTKHISPQTYNKYCLMHY